MKASNIIKDLEKQKDKKRAVALSRFFKTDKGQYGEGDIFIGITLPVQREIVRKYRDLPLPEIQKLLKNKIHEYRSTALCILNYQYTKSDAKIKKKIVDFYLKNTRYINNWDLVDISCHGILGDYYLNNKGKEIFYKLAKSRNLWERRIAIISTFEFIRNNKFNNSLKIAEILLNDQEDLIQKAVGWMLREIGKRNLKVEYGFLDKHYKVMPRTMLRYAIEKFSEDKRKYYMAK